MEWTFLPVLCAAGCMLAGYLLGSINFAIIITRLFGKGDIRDYGSGNAGMTNVLRTVGKGAAALTLLGDFSKGIVAVILARIVFHLCFGAENIVLLDYLVAYSALLGHTFPVFYGFKGGKGILVSDGAMFILAPWTLLICLSGFLIVTAITKYVSAGSIIAALLFPAGNILTTYLRFGHVDWLSVLLAVPIMLFVIYLHHANIGRLIHGTERKISFKKPQ